MCPLPATTVKPRTNPAVVRNTIPTAGTGAIKPDESFSDELGERAIHELGNIALKGEPIALTFQDLRYATRGKSGREIVHGVRWVHSAHDIVWID